MPQVSYREIDVYSLLFSCPRPSVLLSAVGAFIFTAVEYSINTELTICFTGLLLVITELFPPDFAVLSRLVHGKCKTAPL